MKKNQLTSEIKTGKNEANQLENVEIGQTNQIVTNDADPKGPLKKLKLTNNFATDYYNTFR